MPILGSASSSGTSKAVIKPGIVIPDGSLDVWKAARDNAANELVEVVAIGDSTTWGSGPTPIYSWLTRVRARSIAAGYTDGGKGLIAPYDDTADYTELTGEIQGIGTNQWDGSYAIQSIIGGGTFTSTTAGQQILFQGKGTMLRIYYGRGGTGDFQYSLDGGAPVTVATNGSGSYRYIETLYIGGLADTTHTLLITNMGGKNSQTTLDTSTPNLSLLVTIQRDKGIVYHKNARSGSWFPDYFDSTSSNGGWSNTLWRPLTAMGLVTPTTTTPSATAFNTGTMGLQQAEDTHPQHPRCRLAILHLGFNDLTNMTNGTTAQSIGDQMATGVTAFCRMAKNAGASALVLSGQLPANGVYRTYGGRGSSVLREAALANGAAWADVTVPLGSQWGSNPHLTKAQYQAQGDWLWDNVLSL